MSFIKFETFEDFKNQFDCVEDLRKKHTLMQCSKEVAEKILGEDIDTCNDYEVRCTFCGSTLFNKVSKTNVSLYYDNLEDSFEELDGSSFSSDTEIRCIDCDVLIDTIQ